MKRALLFDMDGTLFDTSYVNFLAYQKALKEENRDLTLEFYRTNCEGRNYKEFLVDLVSVNKIETVHSNKVAYYPQFLSMAKQNVRLFDVLVELKLIYSTGLVTTASRENTEEILRVFERRNLFDIIIAKEDIQCTKPNPECYLKAMQLLDCEPQNTIIFEDSEIGLRAAVESGANVVRVERFQFV